MPVWRIRCHYCGQYFCPDYRHLSDQKACERNECRRGRKNDAQRRWLKKNKDYFAGRYSNTKSWRDAHPGYQRTLRKKHKTREIQDACPELSAGKSIYLPRVGDLLMPEIQDACPTVPHSSSMSYPRCTGSEIQDAIQLDILVGYIIGYDRQHFNRSIPIFRKPGNLHLPP